MISSVLAYRDKLSFRHNYSVCVLINSNSNKPISKQKQSNIKQSECKINTRHRVFTLISHSFEKKKENL